MILLKESDCLLASSVEFYVGLLLLDEWSFWFCFVFVTICAVIICDGSLRIEICGFFNVIFEFNDNVLSPGEEK